MKNSPGPNDFSGGFYYIFREELIPMFLKLKKKSEAETITHSVRQASPWYLNLKKTL